MDKIQQKVDELHKLLAKELDDAELPMVLRAALLAVKKELEALVWAVRQLVVEEVANVTSAVNEKIADDWADPKTQVDPNTPHVFKDAAKAEEPALD